MKFISLSCSGFLKDVGGNEQQNSSHHAVCLVPAEMRIRSIEGVTPPLHPALLNM